MARTINGTSGGLKYTGATSPPSAWTVAAWIRPRSCGSNAQFGGRILSLQQSTNPYTETILVSMRDDDNADLVNQLWVEHKGSGGNASSISVEGTMVRDRWQYVAGVHVGLGTKPVIYAGGLGSPAAPLPLTYSTAGGGSTLGSGGVVGVGNVAAANSYWFDGDLAHVTWWNRALSQAEVEWWRTVTLRAGGQPANSHLASLFAYWPLVEVDNVTARDKYGARNLAATSTRPALSPRLMHPQARHLLGATSAANATVTPSAVAATVAVPAATITASATATPTAVAATTAVNASAPSTATARTLNGTSQGFENTAATAITTSTWSWCGHVRLDTTSATQHLWYTTNNGGTRISNVTVEQVDGYARLRAYQLVTNGTYNQTTWLVPLAAARDYTIGVVYNNSDRSFRAYIGDDTAPMTELQWRYETLQGSLGQNPYAGNTRWFISPSSGYVDGTVSWVCVTNDTLTVAEMDQLRRYGDAPASNVVGWWKLNETSGNATDYSGNSRTLTAVASPGSTSRTPTPPAESAETITLTSVVDHRTFQRDGSDQATVPLDGTYTGSPSQIQARFVALGASPGSWTTVVASPSGGTYSTTLTVATGQGTLEVRANYAGTYAYVRRAQVAVGDIYWTIGTSNGVGYGSTYQTVGAGLGSDWAFGDVLPNQLSNWDVSGTHQWIEMGDPTDATGGSIRFGPSESWSQSGADSTKEPGSVGGSWLPQLAGRLVAAHGVPVAICQVSRGGSTLANWRKTTNTHWAELKQRCEQVSGDTVPIAAGAAGKAILAVQGENDYGSSASTTYATDLAAWAAEIGTDLGLPIVLMNVGDWPGSEAYQSASNPNDGITLVRQGILSAVASSSTAELGPVMYDVDLADGGGDTHHYITTAELGTVADRWFAALSELYYSAGSVGHGPRVASAVLSSSTVTVTYDATLDSAGGGYPGLTVYHGSTNSAANRLTWVASSPAAGQYSAVRSSSTTATITLGFSPTAPVWIGVGEYDLSVGLAVPTTTRTVGSVSVVLPAEPLTDRHADPAPSAVTATSAVLAPTVTAASSTTVTPSTVTAATAVATPTVTASATVSASAVTATTAVAGPTVTTSTSTTVTPSTVTATTAVLSPTVTATAVIMPSAVAATTAVAAPTILAGSATTVSASVVTATTAVPTAALSQTVKPSVAAAATAVPTPTPAATAAVLAGTVAATTATLAPAVHAAATAAITTITATTSVLTPTIVTTGSSTVTPSAVVATVAVMAPVVLGSEPTVWTAGRRRYRRRWTVRRSPR